MTRFVCGVDLGQSVDPTAIAVLDRGAPGSRDRRRGILRVRAAQRLALGAPYATQLDRIVQILQKTDEPGAGRRIAIDATGLGGPVLELARGVLFPSPIGITITSGATANMDDSLRWRIPKQDLVGSLQVVLQNRKLKAASRLPERRVLDGELKAFRTKLTATGSTYANDAVRAPHDDLVIALCLATYLAKRADSGTAAFLQSIAWECERCGMATSNRLQSCENCGADKPPPIDPEELSLPEPEPWVCSSCLALGRHVENPGTRDRCRCGWWRCNPPEPEVVCNAETHVPPTRRRSLPSVHDPRTWWPG